MATLLKNVCMHFGFRPLQQTFTLVIDTILFEKKFKLGTCRLIKTASAAELKLSVMFVKICSGMLLKVCVQSRLCSGPHEADPVILSCLKKRLVFAFYLF